MTNKFEEAVQECVWPSFDDNGKFVTTEFDNVDALLKCVEENFGKKGLLFAKYEIYCIETNDHFSKSFDEWCASKDEQQLDTLLECSEKAEDVKLGKMESWLDSQLANTNPNSQKHEHIFKLYNSISDIRTFYAQHLFNNKESV
tara:strand:- start:530 stop:961 length:432 start_codon:yes stop_codon:yes gene_type:complete